MEAEVNQENMMHWADGEERALKCSPLLILFASCILCHGCFKKRRSEKILEILPYIQGFSREKDSYVFINAL